MPDVSEVVPDPASPVVPADDGGQAAELQSADPGVPVVDPAAPEVKPEPETKPEDALNKRFKDVTRDRDEARRQANEATRRLDIALAALGQQTGKPEPAKVMAPEDPEPVEPKFEDPEQYQRDMAEYTRQVTARTVRTQLKAAQIEQERAHLEGQKKAQQTAQAQAWAKRREQAIADIPDYIEVAERDDVPISMAMASAIAIDEQGTKIAYYLGQHPEEAARINALPPLNQVLEIGALRSAITAPAKVTPTKVPPPIKPLGGGATPAAKSPDEMSMEEYAAMRRSHSS